MPRACAADNAPHAHGATRTEVFIVDDVPSMRERLRELVSEVPDVDVVGDAGTPADAIAGILAKRPACVLLDYQLDRRHRASTCCAPCTAHAPGTVFVVLTNHPDPQYRRACMDAGADHFFDKSTEFECVADVLRTLRDARRPS